MAVEVRPSAAGDEAEQHEGGQHSISSDSYVCFKPASRLVFRPFSVCVYGIYDAVVNEVAALVHGHVSSACRVVHVSQRTLRRSQLADISDDALAPGPFELVVVAHRIAGQRNPLTDDHGLYSKLLSLSWLRADAVLLVLLDLPHNGYLAQLMEEQLTVQGMLCTGRLLPFFVNSPTDASSPKVQPQDGAVGTSRAAAYCAQSIGDWLVRGLDGRLPRVDSFSALTHRSEAWRKLSSDVANAEERSCSTSSILAAVAEQFGSQALMRD